MHGPMNVKQVTKLGQYHEKATGKKERKKKSRKTNVYGREFCAVATGDDKASSWTNRVTGTELSAHTRYRVTMSHKTSS